MACYVSQQISDYCNEPEAPRCLDCDKELTEVGMTSCLSYTKLNCECGEVFYLGDDGLEREDD